MLNSKKVYELTRNTQNVPAGSRCRAIFTPSDGKVYVDICVNPRNSRVIPQGESSVLCTVPQEIVPQFRQSLIPSVSNGSDPVASITTNGEIVINPTLKDISTSWYVYVSGFYYID